MRKITIIDYGCGNILSIERAISKVGYKTSVSRDLQILENSTHLILPGVGAFRNAMSLLNKYELVNVIKKHAIEKKKPLLGICLGMQLLFTSSNEFGFYKGLNLIEGKVEKNFRPGKKKN